tara:strand:- start:2346 stop:2588 length:243 start_codon:yes stop_codon:yes gene_type:complete
MQFHPDLMSVRKVSTDQYVTSYSGIDLGPSTASERGAFELFENDVETYPGIYDRELEARLNGMSAHRRLELVARSMGGQG